MSKSLFTSVVQEASQAIPLLKIFGTWYLRQSGPGIYTAPARRVPEALSTDTYFSNLELSSAINLTPLIVISSPHFIKLSIILSFIIYISVTRETVLSLLLHTQYGILSFLTLVQRPQRIHQLPRELQEGYSV